MAKKNDRTMLDTMEMNFNCSKNLVYDLLINPTEIHKLIHKGMKLKKEDENVYSVVFYKVPWRIEVYPKEDSLIEYTVEADKSKKGFINSIAKKGLKEICIFIELEFKEKKTDNRTVTALKGQAYYHKKLKKLGDGWIMKQSEKWLKRGSKKMMGEWKENLKRAVDKYEIKIKVKEKEKAGNLDAYRNQFETAINDEILMHDEAEMLKKYREDHNISDEDHQKVMKDFDGKFMDLSNKKFGAKIKEMMKKIKEMEKKIEKMRNIAPTLSNYLAQIVKDKEHLKIPIMAADNAFSALQIFVDSYYLKKKDKKYPENDKDENNKWVMDAIVQVDIDKKIEKRIQRMVDLHEEIEKAKRAGRWPHPESCYEMMIEWTYVSAWYSKII